MIYWLWLCNAMGTDEFIRCECPTTHDLLYVRYVLGVRASVNDCYVCQAQINRLTFI